MVSWSDWRSGGAGQTSRGPRCRSAGALATGAWSEQGSPAAGGAGAGSLPGIALPLAALAKQGRPDAAYFT